MKKNVIFLLCIILLSCNTKKNEEIRIDNSFAKEFAANKQFENRNLSFSVENKITLDINNDDIKDSIIFENCVGWENSEPGDFRQLQFSINNNPPYIFKNYDAWIKIPERLKKYTDNDYFIPVKMGFENPVLVFISYNYASDPGYLTLYTYQGNEIRSVFNKKVWLRDVEIMNNGLQKLVVDYNYGEEPFGIWVENGELKFEKEEE